ncbi:MAG: radical SAM protein, partial [Prolixibacteraceae bacterium]|nr:radical SAM protein [Prolixibacteraceae bacterium]
MNTGQSIINSLNLSESLKKITEKVFAGKRITTSEALELFQSSNLSLLGVLAGFTKERLSGKNIFFNKNFHIEPTNICVNHCKFCSYRRKEGQKGAWEYSIEEIVDDVKKHISTGATEVHIVGGVHPSRNVNFYVDMLQSIKKAAPGLHIKAFTAVEIDQMCQMANIG